MKFPTNIAPDQVRVLVDEYQALEAKHTETVQAIRAAERAYHAAQEADGRALAEAISAGDKEPDDRQVKKAEAAVEQARRRLQGIRLAIETCEKKLLAAVDTTRTSWLSELEQQQQQRRAKFAEAVEQLAQTHEQLAETSATIAWVRHFGLGSQHRPYQPKGGGVLPTWRQPNGSFASMPDLLRALREFANPTDPTAPRVVVGVGATADGAPLDPDRKRLQPRPLRQVTR